MKRKLVLGIIGGILGFIIGTFIGFYFGLVLGGTFLGAFDIYEKTGFEGYELAAYCGAIIGAITLTIFGIQLLWKIDKKK